MKKQVKYKKLKKIDLKGRFYTRIMLLLVIFPGILFTKWVVRTDRINLIPEEEFQKILESCEENKKLLSEGEITLTLNNCPLPWDREENIWYVAQNPEVKTWEGILGVRGKDVGLYLLDDGYMKKKEEAIHEGHLFQAAVVKEKEYARTSLIVSGMPVISIETKDTWQPSYPVEDIDNYVFNSELRYMGEIQIFHASGNSGTCQTTEDSIGGRIPHREKQGYLPYQRKYIG